MSLAILCSGQAGQSRDMLTGLLEAEDLADVRDAATRTLGRDLATWWEGLNEDEVFENANAQFSIALFQIAAWRRLSRVLTAKPIAVAGYSLGEVIAWHVAGSISVAETLQLVLDRARIMDACVDPAPLGGSCLALLRGRSSPSTRRDLDLAMTRHGVGVAICRPGGAVLGAPWQSMAAFYQEPVVRSVDLKRLPVTVPSHTRYLDGAVGRFRERIAAGTFRDPAYPVVSGTRGGLQRRGVDATESLSEQLAHTIRWDWCMETLGSLGVRTAIELGPGNDLSKTLEAEQAGIAARAVHEFAESEDMGEWLANHSG